MDGDGIFYCIVGFDWCDFVFVVVLLVVWFCGDVWDYCFGWYDYV